MPTDHVIREANGTEHAEQAAPSEACDATTSRGTRRRLPQRRAAVADKAHRGVSCEMNGESEERGAVLLNVQRMAPLSAAPPSP
jgi:hypothetical protein